VRRLALLSVLSALLLPASAQATFPGANGKIAFFGPSACLQMVNPDGTGRTEPGVCGGTSAAISPDGERVLSPVYNAVNDVYDRRNSKLDGTDAIVIPGFSYYVPSVAWSYDGKLISTVTEYTCAECPGGTLYVALADGTGTERYLTDVNPYDRVSWGSGGQIAYSVTTSFYPYSSTIETIGPGGHTVVATGSVGGPDWSPDADRIVFIRGSEIAVVNADGSGIHDLTSNSAADYRPRWSPDGQKILFSSDRDGDPYEIYVMNPDGTSQVNLTRNPAVDRNAIWSPDGKQIAFESNRDGDYDIYVVNRDGSGLVQVTNDPVNELLQDWQAVLGPQRSDYESSNSFCKAERAFLGDDAFARRYGTNNKGANAFGKCASSG
jgi:dipeptidyl aminopeptidase/acylaminoacyl peptidase